MLYSNKLKIEKLMAITEMIEDCKKYIDNFKDNKKTIPSVFYNVIEQQKKGIEKYTKISIRLQSYYNYLLSKIKPL